MIQIAEELLQEPSEKTPSVDDDDEEMLFCKELRKKTKKNSQKEQRHL